MVGSSEYGEGAVRISVADPGGSSRIFKKHVGDIPAHGFGFVDDEYAAAAHRLKICGALHRAKLADAQHRTSHRRLESHWIGHQHPHIWMRLQNQWSSLDHRGVGAFAALGQALLDQALRLSEQRDALAGVAFATRIIGQALAICSLRKKPRQSVLADTTRPGE